MGVSLNGGTPISHPKMIIFSRKPMAVGYHHFRKPPYDCCIVEGHPWQVIHEGQKVPEVLKGCSADPAMFEVVVPTRSNQQERKLMSQESLWCHGWLMITESPTFPVVLALPASMFSMSSVPTTTHNPVQNDTGHTGVQSSSSPILFLDTSLHQSSPTLLCNTLLQHVLNSLPLHFSATILLRHFSARLLHFSTTPFTCTSL